MGQQDAGQVAGGQPQLPESGGDTAGGDARVQQNVGALAADEQAVALRAAGEYMYGQQWS